MHLITDIERPVTNIYEEDILKQVTKFAGLPTKRNADLGKLISP